MLKRPMHCYSVQPNRKNLNIEMNGGKIDEMAFKKYLITDNKLTFYEHVDVAAKMIKGNILYNQNMSLPKQLKNFCFAHTNSHKV